MRVLLPFLFILLGRSISVDAADVTQRVRSTGIAVVQHGDLPGAFEQARRAALRQAVEEGVGVLITSMTRVQNFAVIDDRILSGTRGYVRSYEVVDQGIDDDGSCRVTIDARVDLGQLHEDLAALELAAAGAGLPRVMCVAAETLAGEPLEWGVVSAELQTLIAGMTGLLNVATMRAGSDLDSSAVDIIVRGTAAVLPTQAPIPMSGGRGVADAGLSTAGATLRLEIGWVDESTPVGILTASGRGAGTSPRAAGERALRHAVSILADSLRATIAEDLRQRAFSTRVVDIVVEGPRVAADLDGLTRALVSGLGPVQTLVPRSVEAEHARFQVHTTAGAFDLARQLSARGLETSAVEILQVTANSLRFAIRSTELTGELEQ